MKHRILIVDDEKSMCELLETALKRRDFEPVWFTSAEEALASLERESFDIVLTDLKMPGMDGIQFCERVVVNRPDIPVVVMTAFGSMETAVAAIRAGAYDFVTKPIEMDLLALTVAGPPTTESCSRRFGDSARLWKSRCRRAKCWVIALPCESYLTSWVVWRNRTPVS